MTQAFNLSQLANNLNSAGQLDATDGLVNAVPVANGGTGASTAAAARTNLDVPSRTGDGASGVWNITANVTTSQVLSAIAGATASAVGTYMFASTSISLGPSSGIGPGNTVAGSSLYPACVRQPQLGGSISLSSLPIGSALSGTWMMMGGNYNSDPSNGRLDSVYTLWLRIV